MAYQALLFCPDEKTARTVTQVLTDLDFTVEPCTEPFAAVKKLMAGHFDAVVVDCDNEQNATLLFKSALNSSHNQTSLAVAVVEGQAGVAKAFRIGANLVLTKPINVEQAKGTLRVARGLLRKSEAAKPATPQASATAAAKPTASARPTLAATPGSPTPRTARPVAPAAPLAPRAPMPPRPVLASVDSNAFSEAGMEATEEAHDSVSPVATDTITAAASATLSAPSPKAELKAISGIARAGAGVASGAASAPAMAREPQEEIVDEEVIAESASTVTASPEHNAGEAAGVENTASLHEAPASEPAIAPGSAESGLPSRGGSKKVLLPVLAAVLLGAAGYFAYTQFPGKFDGLLQLVVKPAAVPAARPAPTPATIPQSASPLAPQGTAPALAPASSAAQPALPATTSVESGPTGTEDEDSDPQGALAKTPNQAKPSHAPVSAKGKASAAAKPAPAPMMIKHNSSRKPDPADAPPPSPLGLATPGSGGSLPNLITDDTNAPQPVLQAINISQGVSKGLLLKKVQPTYPPSALRMRVEGTVELMATISSHGDVGVVKVLSGMPLLADAATAAVRQWKYKPYLLNGAPVEITTEITVKFKVPQ